MLRQCHTCYSLVSCSDASLLHSALLPRCGKGSKPPSRVHKCAAMARRVSPEHRSWAEIGGTGMGDVGASEVDCGVPGCSYYVRLGVRGVSGATRAASSPVGGISRRAMRSFCAARRSRMNVSATRRVTTIYSSAPSVPA